MRAGCAHHVKKRHETLVDSTQVLARVEHELAHEDAGMIPPAPTALSAQLLYLAHSDILPYVLLVGSQCSRAPQAECERRGCIADLVWGVDFGSTITSPGGLLLER
jgi:hypothetical protein